MSRSRPPFTEPRPETQPDLAPFRQAPKELRDRIQNMIERHTPYFILVGSDPDDSSGCCPSDLVGAANRLVEAGLLDALERPTFPGACSATVYALAGEINASSDRPAFAARDEFRAKALRALRALPTGGLVLPLRILRWLLLGFVAFSVVFGLLGDPSNHTAAELRGALALENENVIVVGLFSGREHCTFCDNIKAHTRSALAKHRQPELESGRLVIREIDVDLPENRHFKDRYRLFTASVVLIQIQGAVQVRFKVLDQAWTLFDDAAAFDDMIRLEVETFMRSQP